MKATDYEKKCGEMTTDNNIVRLPSNVRLLVEKMGFLSKSMILEIN